MKCFCCRQNFNDQSLLKNHYLTFPNVDENNHFFKKLFTEDNAFLPRKCFRCEYFCLNRRDEKNHNFVFHYKQGGRQPAEDKPIQRNFFDQNLQRYCINFANHNAHYNCYDSRKIVSDFLIVFENPFVPPPDFREVRFKFTFTIANRQLQPAVGFVKLTDSRVWQTNAYEGIYFNDFIKANLAEEVLKRVNGITNSSWCFKRFDGFCIVNSDEFKNIANQ